MPRDPSDALGLLQGVSGVPTLAMYLYYFDFNVPKKMMCCLQIQLDHAHIDIQRCFWYFRGLFCAMFFVKIMAEEKSKC